MREEKGFTFLEIMVAVAILSIALVAALRAQSQSLSIAGESIRSTNVVFLARKEMAKFELETNKAEGNIEEGKTEAPCEENPEFYCKTEVMVLPTEPDGQVHNNPNLRLYQVTKTISWKEGSREKNYIIQTLIAKNNVLWGGQGQSGAGGTGAQMGVGGQTVKTGDGK